MGILCSPVRMDDETDPPLPPSTERGTCSDATEDVLKNQTEGMFADYIPNRHFYALMRIDAATVCVRVMKKY